MPERVAPADVAAIGSDNSTEKIIGRSNVHRRWSDWKAPIEALAGFIYIISSIAIGYWYFIVCSVSLTNDMWWPNFNTTSTQTFLADLCNIRLGTTISATLDLFARDQSLLTNYNTDNSAIAQSTVYPRHYMLGPVFEFEDAIQGIHATTIPFNLRMFTQYCWLDFEKRMDIAHTAGRQDRCQQSETDNAAVHLEAMLRNLKWSDVVAYFGGQSQFQKFESPTFEFPGGREWMESVKDAFVDMESEVKYWKSKRMTRWQLQWQNAWQQGVDETVTIHSALGLPQSLTIKSIPYYHRGPGPWTSIAMYSGFWNEIGRCINTNFSIIRGASNHFTTKNFSFEMAISFKPQSVITRVWHEYVGTYNTIDMKYISIPPSLDALYTTFRRLSLPSLHGHLSQLYNGISEIRMDPAPLSWKDPNYSFYGGNPMCLNGQQQSYIQQNFGFDDACLTQDPLTYQVYRFPLVLALIASNISQLDLPAAITEVCGQCVSTNAACVVVVKSALEVSTRLQLDESITDLVSAVVRDVSAANISIIQFATNSTTPILFREGILGKDIGWSVFGWIQLIDWASNRREVVRFEGDISALPLMSRIYSMQSYQPSSLRIPRSVSQYFVILAGYLSIQLGFVALLMLCYGIYARFRVLGRNLWRFNRVAGSLWVGRLILTVRGLTAIILLSTTQLQLIKSNYGATQFEFKSRHVFEIAIVVGEATWLIYVVQDMLVVYAKEYSYYYAPLSTFLAWLILCIIEGVSPIRMTVDLKRKCKTLVMGKQISCSSGDVYLGDSNRFQMIILIQIGCVIFAYVCAYSLRNRRQSMGPNLVVGGVAEAYLERTEHSDDTDILILDDVTCIMCGLLTVRFREIIYTFDIKLWVVFEVHTNTPKLIHGASSAPFRRASLKRSKTSSEEYEVKPYRLVDKLAAGVGFMYMLASLGGMVLYIVATQVNMSNDLWWAGYNSSGTHAFLGNWYNSQLLLNAHGVSSQLTTLKYSDLMLYNTSSTVMPVSQTAGRAAQFDEISTLLLTIESLRQMDGCRIPWIMTQYCWLDFTKQYEMANTATRQERCTNMGFNGAVFMESALRNMKWQEFNSCWKDSFEVAIASELRTTVSGMGWLQNVQRADLATLDEENYWKSFGITTYTTQYQNYKTIGLKEQFRIQNAFGISYPMTIKSTKGTMQLGLATTLKLYWTLASDFWAVAAPGTLMTGTSLLRRSSNFAFSNMTITSVLIMNASIARPYGISYSFFESRIGPFGSVDAIRIPIPTSLREYYKQTMDLLMPLLATQAQVEYVEMPMADIWNALPKAWAPLTSTMGGNILCPDQVPYSGGGLLSLWQDGGCSLAVRETSYSNKPRSFTSALALGLALPNVTKSSILDICSRESSSSINCQSHLFALQSFIQTNVHSDVIQDFFTAGQRVQKELQTVGANMYQILPNATTKVFRSLVEPLLNENDREFHYFGWSYILEWLVGRREVVHFQGDVGSLVLISYVYFTIDTPPNPLEMPYNVAFYFRACVLYVTGILLVVAILVTMHVIASRGCIEGWNIRKINRVGGVVWAGRPLLFLRSIVAICLVSTSSISLEQYGPLGALTAFSTKELQWYTVILASMEVVWFADVIGDILVIFTKAFTMTYTLKCTILVWFSTVSLTFASPVSHLATIERSCTSPQLDFQVTCQAGTVYVSSFTRFCQLIGVSIGSIAVSYFYERIRNPHLIDAPDNASILLSSGARYLFQLKKWQYNGYCYLDKASGVINGVLCLEYNRVYYLFDIKLWKTFVLRVPDDARVPQDHPMHERLSCAFPLLDHHGA